MKRQHRQDTALRDNLSESQLLEDMKKGDVEAFRRLFDQYQPIAFRFVLFRTHDAALSHDIVQETFLRVWERRASLRPHLGFLALLLRISGNLVLDIGRRNKTRETFRERISTPSPSERDNPEEAFDLSTLQQQLEEIINNRLPERCRSVFLLSRFEGKSNQEIADMLGISVRTVEHQIGHALKVIRGGLKEG